LATVNITIDVAKPFEIEGYDVATGLGPGAATDYNQVESDITYSNSAGGFSWGANTENGYRTFMNFTTNSNGNITGTITTVTPSGDLRFQNNWNNLWLRQFTPAPLPGPPSPLLNPEIY